MSKKSQILKKHPYAITFNEKNERWYTRFNSGDKIIQRNRKTRQELEECIIEFYTNGLPSQEDIYTFSDAHDRWMEAQKEYGKSNNSIRRYESDWRRFFANTDFAAKDIKVITPKDIEVFMIDNIRKFNLKRRGSDGLYSCINGVFYNAVMDKIIPKDENPCIFVDKKKFVRFYNTEDKTLEERTLSREELDVLIERVDADINNNETYIYPYGVKLSLLTGMRVGEIAGLRWSHVRNNSIVICESEKYDVVEKRYLQDRTKNSKIRSIPITDHLRQFLDMMKSLQNKYGMVEDFVLSFNNQKLRCKNLTAYMNHKSEQIKFENHKSIYHIRRTFNSYLRIDGASATEAGGILGNTPKVNDMHYTYDIQDMERKMSYVSNAEQKMVGYL